MQPESNESSPYTSNQTTPSEPNASQYGFLPEQLHSADERGSLEEESVESAGSHNAVEAGSRLSDDATLQEQSRRLSVGDNSTSKPKPSFSRISDYENALSSSPPRKQSEGPGFNIIKKKGSKTDGIQLDQFPNGMSTQRISTIFLLS